MFGGAHDDGLAADDGVSEAVVVGALVQTVAVGTATGGPGVDASGSGQVRPRPVPATLINHAWELLASPAVRAIGRRL